MLKPHLIIVTGAPGTGKTTLARQLATDLILPLIYKDGIKETLFDALGIQDLAWSRRLGRASYDLLEHFAGVLLQAGQSFIIESNFHKELALPMFVKLQERRGYRPLQILCRAEPAILLARRQARTTSGNRHLGHHDERVHEHFDTIELTTRYGFLDIGGERMVWDTTDLTAVDYEGLMQQITFFSK